MTIERYFQWMKVWKWFQTVPGTPELESLYDMLNVIWKEEHDKISLDQLAQFRGAWELEERHSKKDSA